MIEIDGSMGEGGGQILRSALALSVVTGTPFRITDIRANRKPKAGLRRQHVTAVRAAAEISGAQVEGDFVESRELTFRPGTLRPGDYTFDIGSAGSTTLVLQTVLPPLLTAAGPRGSCWRAARTTPARRPPISSNGFFSRSLTAWARAFRSRWSGRASRQRAAGG
jgi:RNA 3'-terminal phosphate cyclase (ATP)